ncbi:MAG: hypothetical protein M3Q49_03640 [Actinomycetota bacterium]|nr:hypothetical protein [Actinomycetota bacterium]
MSTPDARAEHPPLSASQLRLVRERREDVARQSEPGVDRDVAALDALADDLLSARLVLRAALGRAV